MCLSGSTQYPFTIFKCGTISGAGRGVGKEGENGKGVRTGKGGRRVTRTRGGPTGGRRKEVLRERKVDREEGGEKSGWWQVVR